MQLPELVSTALGWLAFEFARLQPFLPTYAHLIVSAILPIYAGAHASLSRPSSAAKRIKAKLEDVEDEVEEEDDGRRLENLSASDAIMFPFIAGATLAGLYFLIKWLQDPALLNKILNWYFAGFSVFSVSRMVSDGLDALHSLAFPHYHVDQGFLYKVDGLSKSATSETAGSGARQSPLPFIFSRIPLPRFLLDFLWFLRRVPTRRLLVKAFVRGILQVNFRLGIHGAEGLIVGLSTVAWYNFVSKPWWLTNLMGFGFAYSTLQLLSPTTFWTGTLVLGGLFFYDIYFVFFTPIMVTVAKSLDVPIKLLFPRPAEPDADPAIQALAMLGLGDIVLPGIMIGLALRFDLFRYYVGKQKVANQQSPSSDTDESQEESGNSNLADKDTATAKVVKATYAPVGEAWGDRLWTRAPLTGFAAKHDFVAANAFPKPYFNSALIGYLAGMVATLVAMQISEHPQPALLYLVPGVLTSIWGRAWVRGEVEAMWQFTDAEEDETKDQVKGSGNASVSKNAAEGTKDSDKGEISPAIHSSGHESENNTARGRMRKQEQDSLQRALVSFTILLPPPLPAKAQNNTEIWEKPRYNLRSKDAATDVPAEKRQRVA